ncbi:TPA: hypothetical protein PTV74_003351 [Clostridium botulinum]|nr:hypothetical protein [Clostridium botulinum]HDK7206506.1 hypothetical protein [Clostridium botulinum]HDK7210241.1 hypothetical protein [Clostridium botulinum]HDK7265691.1 hypothetical protein [Clostridium botulinum]HDK7269538.1 hypothetical protein [Clostridium botulinum]
MDGGIVNEKLFDELIQELEYSVLESTIPKEEYIKLQKFVEKLGKISSNNNIFKGERPVNITINIESRKDSHSLARAVIKNLKESEKL